MWQSSVNSVRFYGLLLVLSSNPVVPVVVSAHSHSVSFLQVGILQPGDYSSDPTPEVRVCNCTCCVGAYRRPTEITSTGEELKCAVNPDAKCNDRCTPQDSGSKVLTGGAEHGIATENFCLMECKMIDAAIGSQCVEMDFKDTLKQVTPGGNGDDQGLPPDITEVKAIEDDPYNPAAGAKAEGMEVVPEAPNAAESKLHELKIATDYANEAIDYVKKD
eukprot:gnl/MRDRNA2_/MRDRNA2_94803_c0_seq1.p1 gnl/MRDRNA2_/MRDRNA2_94803_c0~~gnl/MRDRNA2_/MRDRNA2_94803_c0_seq1.p1  ORF type:complete len:218 (+),score=47.37 gnl/MRDRNA2_/MRDRNA2_94803_c0_seq1:96-749(+)